MSRCLLLATDDAILEKQVLAKLDSNMILVAALSEVARAAMMKEDVR